jgi:hypothetical protein
MSVVYASALLSVTPLFPLEEFGEFLLRLLFLVFEFSPLFKSLDPLLPRVCIVDSTSRLLETFRKGTDLLLEFIDPLFLQLPVFFKLRVSSA